MRKVIKFGGNPFASVKQFKKVGDIIRFSRNRRYVIPSAPDKHNDKDEEVVDMLYQCYEAAFAGDAYKEILEKTKSCYEKIIDGLELDLDLTHEFETTEENFVDKVGRDYAASRGGYLNGLVMVEYLGFEFMDAADMVFFHEDGSFDAETANRELDERLEPVERAVTPRFYGATADGTVRTSSRDGPDVADSLVAKAIHTDIYENWADMSGFLVADPRVIKNPEVIETITYRELRELAYMGTSMPHENAIFPVREGGIPINIRSANKPEDKGTLIMESICREPWYMITGIAGREGFYFINTKKVMMNTEVGFDRKVLEAFEKYGISFERIPSGIDTMTVFVHQSEFEEYEQSMIAGTHYPVESNFAELEPDLASIAVVGRGIEATRGTTGRIFSTLAYACTNIRMIGQGPSELNIIIDVKNSDLKQAIRAIYNIFIMAGL